MMIMTDCVRSNTEWKRRSVGFADISNQVDTKRQKVTMDVLIAFDRVNNDSRAQNCVQQNKSLRKS